nr:hypothetical protein GCM10020093_095690 [Planobispora longispora]
MIATLITATVLATTVTGGLGSAEAWWSCPRALTQLPDHIRRWIPESLRALSVADCRPGRPEAADPRSPEPPARVHRPAATRPPVPGPRPGATPETPGRKEPASKKPALREPAPGKSERGESEPLRRQPERRKPESSRRQPERQDHPSPGQIAAAAALRQLGTPYVWGGGSSTGPTRGGFDCSGLALHAWSKAGVTLTHYTGTQFRQGRRVPFSQLRPGDLVFFGAAPAPPPTSAST